MLSKLLTGWVGDLHQDLVSHVKILLFQANADWESDVAVGLVAVIRSPTGLITTFLKDDMLVGGW